ncbi:MAG: tol-pal system YbgF family protein [Planctomycetota bacterium]
MLDTPELTFSLLLWPTFLVFLNGALMTFAYICFETLREDPWWKLITVVYLLMCLGAYLQQLPDGAVNNPVTYWAYMVAFSGSLPVFLYVSVGAISAALAQLSLGYPAKDPLYSQRARWHRKLRRALRRGDLRLLEARLADLGDRPTDPVLRSQLIDLYLGLGDVDGALYHAYALVELLPRGHAHGYALYRLAQILVEQRKRLDAAQPYLRRIIRLYPRSFFASYARRLVNQFEAYAE